MNTHSELIHEAQPCQVAHSEYARFTRIGNKLYIHVYFWPDGNVAVGGLKNKVLAARLYPSGQSIQVHQDEFRTQFLGLPARSPDSLASVIEVECDGEPIQDQANIRQNRPRLDVGV